MLPLAWPNYLVRHVEIKTTETMDTQICADKWAAVSGIMLSTLVPSAPNREHRAFIADLGALRASIQLSNSDMVEVRTEHLMKIYDGRHVFDEIGATLNSREADLSNVTMLPGAIIPKRTAEAETVLNFKKKYEEMMETAILPLLIPGWAKENTQPEEKRGTAPWGISGRRPF